MIIILFRGREINAQQDRGGGTHSAASGICHLPSTLPGWEVGISKDNQPPAMLRRGWNWLMGYL